MAGRPERLKIDYREFDPADADNDPASVPSEIVTTGNNLTVHVADGREGGTGPDIWVPRSFQSPVKSDLELMRDRIIAKQLKGRVVSTSVPGVNLNEESGNTTFGQKWNTAARGDFRANGAAQLQAAQEALPDLAEGSTLDIIAYSLANATAIGGLSSEVFKKSGLKLGKFHGVEAVNGQDWDHLLLTANGLQPRIGKEDEATNRYLKETYELFGITAADRDPNDPTKVIKEKKLPFPIDSALIGAGLRKGFAPAFAEHLAREKSDGSTAFEDAEFTFYRANGSGVTPPENVAQTSRDLNGRVVELHPSKDHDPHRHPVWQSLGSVGMLMLYVQEMNQKG